MKAFLRLVLTLLFIANISASHAASSVLVWPVYQIIEADQNGSALWLENRGSADVTLQVRVLTWKQLSGQDRYADQDNVVASPPFATVPPGQRQLIRLMRTNPVTAGTEQAYRIIIDEIPTAAASKASSHSGLHLQMRYLLPLFLDGDGIWTKARSDKKRDPSTATRPQLSWRITRENGVDMLAVRNQGIVHARLSNVFWGLSATQTKQTLAQGFLGYVLPGQEMRWPLPGGQRVPPGQQLFAQLSDNSTPVALPPAH